MTKHYCVEHQTPFFRKGNMKSYAHPVKDEEGEPVLNDEGKRVWCNEAEEENQPRLRKEPDQDQKPDYEPLQRQSSIETQNAYSGIPALLDTMAKYPNDPLVLAAYHYAANKLSKWYSQGEVEKKSLIEMKTEEQGKRISAIMKKKGYSNELAMSIMVSKFKVGTSKALTEAQANEFIKLLESGYMLDKPEEIELGNMPF